MKWFTLSLTLLLLVAALPAFATDKAKSLFEKGRLAEAREDYEAAYADYHQAYQLKPTDLTYRSSFERVRFLAAASHVHRGELLVSGGKLQEALTEFETAIAIDPSSFIAQQQAAKTRKLIQQNQNAPAQQEAPTTPESALTKRMEEAPGPVELAPIAQTPITLKLTEDAKTVYETIGKLAGINVLFDPDYTSRRIRVDLNGVTLEEALEITALQSKTFWRPVTPNTIFVAGDTPAKRKELEQSVIRTFYLTNLSQPNELQDLVNILRTLLDTQRLQQFPSQQAIVVRGTPDQIAMAEKLIDDLDKSRPEVVIEVAIMTVNRDRLHDLGINPPTSATIQLQNPTTTTTTSVNTNSGNGGTGSTSTSSSVTLNQIAHLNASDFAVTIPQATANFLFSDSNSRILQKPEIRAADGQKASLKIGQRVPVATGSFQPGIGGVGINPLVNTQFNYIDVGVNIDITPRVHGIDEVSLKVAMDISEVDNYTNIGGIQQPIIGQRKIEQEIRLREGEVNIMGGILEDTQTKSISGWPGFAQIPLFKYLFSETKTEHINNEIVFVLTPHIVRAQSVADANIRPVDVGTANTLALRHGMNQAPDQQHGNQPGQTTPGTTPNQQQPNTPGARPQGASQGPAASAPAGSAIVSFDPPTLDQVVGSTFTVNVNLAGGQNVYSVPVQVLYNPRVLQLLNVSNGTLLSQDGQTVALVKRDDSMTGVLQLTASRPPGSPGISGDGSVFTLTFQAKAPGQATLSVNRAMVRNASMENIPAGGSQAIVTVH